jgi:hypothetical protein
VDRLLRGQPPGGMRRTPGQEQALEPIAEPAAAPAAFNPPRTPLSTGHLKQTVRIYPYAFSRDLLERVIRDLRLDVQVVNRAERAHLIVTLRARAGDSRLQRLVELTGLPVHAVKKNSTAQIRHLLRNLFNLMPGTDEHETETAVRETEDGIRRALREGVVVALMPRPASLRRLQHRVASRHHMVAESVGSEPQRHLVIYPHAFSAIAEDKAS